MSGEAQTNALARLLFVPVCEPSTSARLEALMEEIRVARLIAHMRPYLVSSATAVTRPMVPVQRRVTHPAEKRLDDITADTRRRATRPPPAAPAHRPLPGSDVPYSGSTR